jgi:hypothetical protein
MAYVNYLASVTEVQVASVVADPSITIDAAMLEYVSHLVAYWVKVQPLGRLLGEAIDGGTILSDSLWHPFRSPLYHPPLRVSALNDELSKAWIEILRDHPTREIDWFRIEIEKVLKLFQHAAERGHCVLSAMESPMDAERASRVHIPLKIDFDRR